MFPRASESICSSIGSNLNRAQSSGPQDLTKALLTDDYFSDANPRSMRRLMNVLYVIGRLLKAFNIEFNWYHLASWINVTEQWPYRLSWIIYFADRQFSESGSSASPEEEASISLKSVYDRIKVTIPTQKDLEPLVDLDRDEKKLDTFLAYHKKNLTLADLKVFLPFTINLDPYIKKVIKEEIQGMEEMGLTVEQVRTHDFCAQTRNLVCSPDIFQRREQRSGSAARLIQHGFEPGDCGCFQQ